MFYHEIIKLNDLVTNASLDRLRSGVRKSWAATQLWVAK